MTSQDHSFSDDFRNRFWARVAIGAPDACWEWTKAIGSGGYGVLWWRGKMVIASRTAWEIGNGPIPNGLHILHSCHNRPCCNPAHLRTGTHKDNMRDKVEAGRQARGDQHSATLKIFALRGDAHPHRMHPERTARGDRNGKHTKPECTPRGTKHGCAKLTEDDVRAIRASTETQQNIAAQFGVHQGTVSSIRLRKIWTHIP